MCNKIKNMFVIYADYKSWEVASWEHSGKAKLNFVGLLLWVGLVFLIDLCHIINTTKGQM